MTSVSPVRALTALSMLAAPVLLAVMSDSPIQSAAQAAETPDSTQNRVLRDSRMIESSGLALSSYNRSVLFTHNDSGDGPRIFAVKESGATAAVLTLRDAKARDWEDIATGPGHSIWVADIGDNARARSSVTVYRVTEPEQLVTQRVAAKRFTFTYPGGRAHNAETLMVSHRSGRLYIATKARVGGALYRAPRHLSTSGVNRLERLAPVPSLVTGGAFFPEGGYVLRTHNFAYTYRWSTSVPRVVRLPVERQGESIESTRSGRGIYTGSEGRQSPVFVTPLR